MHRRSLPLLITVTMVAFAANSVLCKLALKEGHIDPVTFSQLRLLGGAAVLLPLLFQSFSDVRKLWSPLNAFCLMIYALFFSIAYIHLDTGTGALMLFGVVQLTMVAYGMIQGERFTPSRAAGFFLAVAGMVLLLLPGASAPPLLSALMMGVAGLAWAVYSISGRRIRAPGGATAMNFLLAVPMVLVAGLFTDHTIHANATGVLLALASGAVASAGAYVLWYSILPHLESVTASTVQLSVPCLAIMCGVLFLGETLSMRMVVSTLLVLAGIMLVVRTRSPSVKNN